MCLQRVTKVYKRPSSKVVTAWKVFDGNPNDLRFEFRCFQGSNFVPCGEWLKAEMQQLDGYPSGFHTFTSRKDALVWGLGQQIVRVKVKYIIARGLQSNMGPKLKTIVSREMFVPKAKKRNRRAVKGE